MSPPTEYNRSTAALQLHRDRLTPENVLRRIKDATGPIVLTDDPGVGKTFVLNGIVAHHRKQPDGGLLLVLTSQTSVLKEYPWVQEHLGLPRTRRATHDIALLVGRPRARCGSLNEPWLRYEQAGCATLGREDLCGQCPRRTSCSWPDQRSVEVLAGKRVIGATQANLATTPRLIAELQSKTGAESVSTLIDEANVLETLFRRTISYDELRASRSEFARAGAPGEWLAAHDEVLDPALDITTFDPPERLHPDIALGVQSAVLSGGASGGRFLAFDIATIPYGNPVRTPTGIEYLARPWLHGPCLIAAAGLPMELARHRLGTQRIEEYSPNRFLHPDTEIYNICSPIGTARHFPTHRAQILWAIAQMIQRYAAEGKRTLVVTKKCFSETCCRELQKFVRDLGLSDIRVVRNPSSKQVKDPRVVALITYGTRGVNRYEHFDVALALCGYHARPDVVEKFLNDVYGPSDQVRIEFTRVDGKRVAIASDYGQQLRGFTSLARDYQHQHETSVAEQALGRVRFAIHPRTVVFFQLGPLRYPLTKEFRTLDAFRRHFGLLTRREWIQQGRTHEVMQLLATGMTVAKVAAQVDRTERQIYRIRAAARRRAP